MVLRFVARFVRSHAVGLLALFVALGGVAYAANPDNGGGSQPEVYAHFGFAGGPPIGPSKHVVEAVVVSPGRYCVITTPGVDPSVPFVANLGRTEEDVPPGSASTNEVIYYGGACQDQGRPGLEVRMSKLATTEFGGPVGTTVAFPQGFTMYAP